MFKTLYKDLSISGKNINYDIGYLNTCGGTYVFYYLDGKDN